MHKYRVYKFNHNTKFEYLSYRLHKPETSAFWQVVVKIWASRKLQLINPIIWICTRFWPLAPPPPSPSMDPGVRCCGMNANPTKYLWTWHRTWGSMLWNETNPTRHLWCMYERFLTSGCQNMDFWKTFMQKSNFWICTRFRPPAWTLGMMSWNES